MRKLRLVSFAALLAGLSTAAASFASAQKTTAAPLVVAAEDRFVIAPGADFRQVYVRMN